MTLILSGGRENLFRHLRASVAELVDALASGASAARRGGSSPLARTTNHPVDLLSGACHKVYPNDSARFNRLGKGSDDEEKNPSPQR